MTSIVKYLCNSKCIYTNEMIGILFLFYSKQISKANVPRILEVRNNPSSFTIERRGLTIGC
jgi:hypothetical protein